jgi:chromosome segregation ATPase
MPAPKRGGDPLAHAVAELSRITANLTQSTSATHDKLLERERELGRLGALEEQLERVTAERDELKVQLGEIAKEAEERVAEEVQAAVKRAVAEHEDRESKLQARIEQLEADRSSVGEDDTGGSETGVMDLASHFASVLESLAEGPPRDDADTRQTAAALTSLDVDARGLLAAPAEEGAAPQFRTPEPGQVDPGQLSTVRMSFRLFPRVPPPS